MILLTYNLKFGLYTRIGAHAGLPLGQEKSGNQEKSGKNLKNDKSQEKMGGFEKKSGNLIKFKKKVRFCQFKFTKFLVFQSLQMVKIN